MQADARAEILRNIRAATGVTATEADVLSEWQRIPRNYRRFLKNGREQTRQLLIDRLRDYDAHVVESPVEELSVSIAKLLHARNISRILIPAGLPQHVLSEGIEFVLETGLSAAEMDKCGGVLTQCALAIAETGTIVLQNVSGQGRRAASLVPDYHLCVVDASRIVATVPQAIAQLRSTATLPTTFISGPSATADIEMTRIKGVHGPRSLDVIVVMGF